MFTVNVGICISTKKYSSFKYYNKNIIRAKWKRYVYAQAQVLHHSYKMKCYASMDVRTTYE